MTARAIRWSTRRGASSCSTCAPRTSARRSPGSSRRWTKGCARDGFVAVEYDNLDSFTRSHGLLKRRDALKFARLLTKGAHRAGLAAGQKNLAGYDGHRVGFDFAVSEECGHYDECDAYVDDFGDQVLMIEYVADDFEATCEAYGATHAVVLRDRDLSPGGRAPWC